MLGGMLPVWIFATVLIIDNANKERIGVERDAEDLIKTGRYTIERELASMRATLAALATSPALRDGNLAVFYEQARDTVQKNGVNVLLVTPEGQQLLNTRAPFGTSLPMRNDTENVLRTVETGQEHYSNVFVGAVANLPLVTQNVPVRIDGRIAYVLTFSIEAKHWLPLLQELTPEGWIVALLDGNGNFITRSVDQDRRVMSPASKELRQGAQRAPAGSVYNRSVEGEKVLNAWTRLSNGWTFAAAVPQKQLEAPLWRSTLQAVGGGLVFFGLSMLLVRWASRRIAQPISALESAAVQLGKGALPRLPATGISEIDGVGRAIEDAADLLRTRKLQRDRAESSLRRAVLDLQRANEETQRFAYIVSHDLRSPLVNIMGFSAELDTLRQEIAARLGPGAEALDQEFQESLGFIRAATSRMDSLIREILILSRSGRREFRIETLDMTPLLQGVSGTLKTLADEAGASIRIGSAPPIESDRVAVGQIFQNLIENAIKYRDFDRPLTITVTAHTQGDVVTFDVADNGRGISDGDLERIFDLFRRAGVQDRPGDGIGLAHVRSLARRLGGDVTVDSELGRGSTFSVRLPLKFTAPFEDLPLLGG